MTRAPGRILILGAGPTGLGAAWRLRELGYHDYQVLEQSAEAGGLASSFVDDCGFTWDVGGHVQFSHYAYYDDVLDLALGDAWLYHQRESWVWMRERFIPYPFQNNIHRLDAVDCARALKGMEDAADARDGTRAADFHQWILSTFGDGIAELFLLPYNFKVWAYPPSLLGIDWMGDRVAVPDLERVRRNVESGTDDVSWGPNSLFRFPKRGGTGAIWRAVASLLPSDRLRFNARVAAVDAAQRVVTLEEGERLSYDTLISALPLDVLCGMTSGLSPASVAAAERLLYSTSHIIGIGLRGPQPKTLQRKCWMYFPEETSPYYRVTVFSNYSPANVPEGEGFWSLMAEVSESPRKLVNRETLTGDTIAALRRDRLIEEGTEVVSRWEYRAGHGYPTPSVNRDQELAIVEPELAARGIFSRGRFGAWRYEVSNQDHTFMQGVEVVDRLLGNGREMTLTKPDLVNSGAFLRKQKS